MARVGRLSGALIVETVVSGEAAWFVVGDTKVPCDWAAAGFCAPGERDVVRERYRCLQVCGAPVLAGTTLSIAVEGEEAAQAIAERLTVARNGSVSERLWRLVLGDDEVEAPSGRILEAAWLCDMPKAIWDVVRDTVLRCS